MYGNPLLGAASQEVLQSYRDVLGWGSRSRIIL